VAGPNPTEARFPGVPTAEGHYESFYLKACAPDGSLGVWIRYTVHKPPGARPAGSVWITFFEAAADGPLAAKETVPEPRSDGGDWIRVGQARLADGVATGRAGDTEWDLRFGSEERPLIHLPADWMYHRRLPRTKLLSPVPAASFHGTLAVGGRSFSLDGWRGMVGHNWGAEHAERWIWLHGITAAGDWLDAAVGRVRVGPLTLPWIANGAVSVEGRRLPVRGAARIEESPDRCEFRFRGRDLSITGLASAPRRQLVAWMYADPRGSVHHAVNCSIADLSVAVEIGDEELRHLEVRGGGAYELGMRDTDHGVDLQPFYDG